jgi:exonuclease VII large subunit
VLRRLPTRVAAGGHRRVVDGRRQQLEQLMRARIASWRASIAAGERALAHLSPQHVLDRGYSITTLAGEEVPLREASRVRPGQTLHTRLASGSLRSVVAGSSRQPSSKLPKPTDQRSLFDEEEKSEE